MEQIKYPRAWIVVSIAGIADLLSTKIGLSVGLSEQNPLGKALLEAGGISGLATLKISVGILVFALCIHFIPDEYRYLGPAIVSILWFSAAGFNTFLILYTTGII